MLKRQGVFTIHKVGGDKMRLLNKRLFKYVKRLLTRKPKPRYFPEILEYEINRLNREPYLTSRDIRQQENINSYLEGINTEATRLHTQNKLTFKELAKLEIKIIERYREVRGL